MLRRLLASVSALALATAPTFAASQDVPATINGPHTFTGPVTLPPATIGGTAFQATGNGATSLTSSSTRAGRVVTMGDDFATVSAAEAAAVSNSLSLVIPAGTWDASGVTFSTPVEFEAGAILACATGSFSFSNSVTASRNTIFASGCAPSFYNDHRQSEVYPEWWGGAGDSNGSSGNGTDNTTAITNAIASGARNITFAAGGNYRYSSIATTASNFRISCPSRDVTTLTQDDPTTVADGIFLHGHSGSIQIDHCNLGRAQAATASVLGAEVVNGGSGCNTGDTISVTGGTYSTQAILTVTASGGLATGLGVATAGVYTKAPTKTQTPIVMPAAATAAVSGACTGVTVKLLMTDPAIIHAQDTYYVDITDNRLTSSNAWNQISIDSVSQNNNQVHVDNNQIFNQENSGVYMYGPSVSAGLGDIFIQKSNYFEYAGFSAIEARGWIGGVFVDENTIYNNNYALFWDADGATGGIFSSKIRKNDIDTNVAGSFFNQLNSSTLDISWHSSGGPLVCTACTSIDGRGFFVSPTSQALVLNGSKLVTFSPITISGGNNPIQLNSYNGINTKQVVMSANWSYGSGSLVTASGSTSQVTIQAQLDTNETVLSGTITNLTLSMPQSPTNQNNNPFSAVLWGQSNTVVSAQAVAGGYGNNVNCYAGSAFGQYINCTGSYSALNGLKAGDDGLNGSNCFSSGSAYGNVSFGNAGSNQICFHTLYKQTSSTTSVRLTSDGLTAAGPNCIALPNNAHMLFSIQVSGKDTTTPSAWADWTSASANVLDRQASAATVAYSGAFSSATTPGASAGAGSTATLQLSADTTNGCLNVSIVPPNGDTWEWTASVIRTKTQ